MPIALALLAAYDWPGNVRQLQSVLFRAAVYAEGDTLTAESFPQLSELLGEQEAGGEIHFANARIALWWDAGGRCSSFR